MTELLILAVAGLLVGAGMSATRRSAPKPLVRSFYALALVALVLVVLTFPLSRP